MINNGLRVLDLSRVLAGPLATMILGDLGARVIKVEEPGRGDETRRWGPPFTAEGESAYYVSVNRNKLSVALDLAEDGDRGTLLELLRSTDVVVENFLPGALERLGLPRTRLIASNPRLIWCTIGGFAREPARPGYDYVVQAESGWMSVNGEPDGDPLRAPVAIADVLAGKDAAIAILAALLGRAEGTLDDGDRTIRVSLLESAVAALVNVAQNVLVSGEEARRWGNGHPNIVPYQLFRARDADVVIAVGNDAQWRACVGVLDLDRLAEDPALATNSGRVAARDKVVSVLAAAVSGREAAELVSALTAAAVPAGRVRTVSEAVHAAGASSATGVPPSVPGKMRLPPPRLDEHGALVRQYFWEAFSQLAADS